MSIILKSRSLKRQHKKQNKRRLKEHYSTRDIHGDYPETHRDFEIKQLYKNGIRW